MREEEFKKILQRALDLESENRQQAPSHFTSTDLVETGDDLGIDRRFIEQAVCELEGPRNRILIQGTVEEVKNDILKSVALRSVSFSKAMRSFGIESSQNGVCIYRKKYPLQRYEIALTGVEEGKTEVSWVCDFKDGERYFDFAGMGILVITSIASMVLSTITPLICGTLFAYYLWVIKKVSHLSLEKHLREFLDRIELVRAIQAKDADVSRLLGNIKDQN